MRNFCTYCGLANAVGASACVACGTPLHTADASIAAPRVEPAPLAQLPIRLANGQPPAAADAAPGDWTTAPVPPSDWPTTPPDPAVPPFAQHWPAPPPQPQYGYGHYPDPTVAPQTPVAPWPPYQPPAFFTPYPGQVVPPPGYGPATPPAGAGVPPYAGYYPPAYGPQAGYPAQPGYALQPGYGPQPGYVPQPGYIPHPGYAPVPGAQQPAYPVPYPLQPEYRAPYVPTPGYSGLADAGQRFGAYLLDSTVVAIPLFAFLMLVGATESAALAGLWLLLSFVVPALYFITCWATTGRTIGYRAMGLQLIRTDGSQPNAGAAIARYLTLCVCLMVFFPGVLGSMWMLWDDKRQAWHDKVADTLVVRS